MDFQLSVVFNKTQFAEFVHEKAHARSGRADHLRQCFLTKLSHDRLRPASSKDVLFQIAHTAGLPNHAAWLFLFSLILAGRLPAVTSDAPATDVLNIAETT
jgi:hypothetical protein